MDVHVPRAVTKGLRARGVDALTAQEDHAAELADPVLLDRATALQRVLVTQDEDFKTEVALRQREGVPFAGVIFAPQRGITIGQFVSELEFIALAGERGDFANRITYLPLR